MSVEAISWALKQPVEHSSAKFVLVVIANCADGQDFTAYPSVAYLAESTGQDRKTVLANLKRLVEAGYLADTGERKGSTKQIIVYRLTQPEPKPTPENSPKNGTGTKNGTVPVFPGNSTVFPMKQSQFSRETVPKTGHGTVIGNVKEPSLNNKPKRSTPTAVALPDWLSPVDWQAFLDHRKRLRSPMAPEAQRRAISALEKLRADGDDPAAVIDQSIVNDWKGFFPLRRGNTRPSGRAPMPTDDFANKVYSSTPDDELPDWMQP